MRKKICGKCEKEKSFSEFGNNKSRPDGKQIYCKSCFCKISKDWRDSNYIIEIMRKKEYYKKNRSKILKRMRNSYDQEKRRVRYLVDKKIKNG